RGLRAYSRCILSSRLLPPPRPTLFPYTTLFRSLDLRIERQRIARDERPRRLFGIDQLRALLGVCLRQQALAGNLHEVRIGVVGIDRKSTRLNSSHRTISYAVFCLKKKTNKGEAV